MQKRKVVVTGLGAVTPCGNSVDEMWENIVQGKTGIGKITLFDTDGFPVKIAGEVKNFEPAWVDPKEAKRLDRFELFALNATYEALEHAGMLKNGEVSFPCERERVGVIIGSGIGGLWTIEQGVRTLVEKGPTRVSPFFIPVSIANMASGYISIKTGALGPNLCTTTACAAGLHAIGIGYDLIRQGICDVAIVGGSEAAITPIGVASFSAMRALSRIQDPSKTPRPFDKDRDGFVMGEGAGVLILEEYELAKKRGAKILCEVKGFGMSSDAHHITAPDPEGYGFFLAMKRALEDSGLSPKDINYINAHGTGTRYNDEIETKAIKRLLGEHAYKVPVSSTKSMTGHLLGAAGAVESVITVLTIVKKVVPPTINLDNPDPECDLDYVPWKAREFDVKNAMCNSFGFGGTNACVIFSEVSD